MDHCTLSGLEDCCSSKAPIQKVNTLLREFLSRVTLDHILHDRVPASLGQPGDVEVSNQQATLLWNRLLQTLKGV